MKINNKRELRNIATNHAADIDYKDFVKIYRERTKEPYSFLTIDTTLPASNPLRFRKICFLFIKMTVTDQIKILDKKLSKIKHSMIWTEKLLKYLHCLLITWINMNI